MSSTWKLHQLLIWQRIKHKYLGIKQMIITIIDSTNTYHFSLNSFFNNLYSVQWCTDQYDRLAPSFCDRDNIKYTLHRLMINWSCLKRSYNRGAGYQNIENLLSIMLQLWKEVGTLIMCQYGELFKGMQMMGSIQWPNTCNGGNVCQAFKWHHISPI